MILDLTSIVNLLLVIGGTVLVIFLAQELKRSYIAAIPLFVFLGILVMHVIQILTLTPENDVLYRSALSWSILLDFVFIFITFFAYLWVDDIEAKKMKKKSLDNSLEWFWKKI